MKHKRIPTFDGLEQKLVLSRTAPSLAQAAAHLLARRQHQIRPFQQPNLHKAQPIQPHQINLHQANQARPARLMQLAKASGVQLTRGQPLKLTVRPSRVMAAQTSGSFGGGNIDTTIPLVLSTQVGAAQNALNFTSNTYQNVLFGSGGWNGIQQIVTNFANSNDTNQLVNDLSALSFRIPYGNQQLLQTWLADLQSLQDGSLTPTASGINWDGNNSTAQAVGDTLFQDLQSYLADGLGTSFNILKSQINWNNSDDLLTYNGTVAANGSNDTTVPVVS